jgi:tetratricopeptide (TPR) repeat protein
VAVVLVGRNRELAEVAGVLDRAARGVGGVLVIVGPSGVGKTAVLDASAEIAAQRGFEVAYRRPVARQPGRLIWAQLLRDAEADEQIAAALLADPDSLTVDAATSLLVSERPRLIVVDDIDRGGPDCIAFLAVLASRVAGAPTVVLASSSTALGISPEVQLKPLSEKDLAVLFGDLPADTRRALWIACRGLPGAARSLAEELRSLDAVQDPLVHLALHAVSRADFLDVDVTLVRLLEGALARTRDDATRARLLARLADALLGDPSAGRRRRELADEALELARRTGDPSTLAEVLDARLSALWDPQGAEDRLAAGSEIVDLARAVGDDARERHGLFWRFVALMELGRVAEAESALAAFEREARLAGDAQGEVMAKARHSMLAAFRGRFDEAVHLAKDAVEQATRVGLPDAGNLRGALWLSIVIERDLAALREIGQRILPEVIRRHPGHYYEASAAATYVVLGRREAAAVELERILPQLLAGSGPRWLGAMANAALAATALDDTAAAARIYEAMSPYAGRLTVFSGAAMVFGPVSHWLGLLAGRLSRYDEALAHFDEAITLEERTGALPYLAHSLAGSATTLEARRQPGDVEAASARRERARSIAERLGMTVLLERLAPAADEWRLLHDGDDWLLEAGDERARLRDGRGLHYLRALLSSPGRDLSALDLVAGGSGGLVASGTGAVLDEAALAAYRRRLAALDTELDGADVAGDAGRAARAEKERQALLDEVRRATGLAGRVRTTSPEAERARVNVTRTLRATIERIEAVAPKAGAHLRASVRTGLACRYEPAAGGPTRWRV